jgi:hypothetical protein
MLGLTDFDRYRRKIKVAITLPPIFVGICGKTRASPVKKRIILARLERSPYNHPSMADATTVTPNTAVMIAMIMFRGSPISSREVPYTNINGTTKAVNPMRQAMNPVFIGDSPDKPAAAYAAKATGGVIEERHAK